MMTLERAIQILNNNKHGFDEEGNQWEIALERDPMGPGPEWYEWLAEEQAIGVAEEYERKK